MQTEQGPKYVYDVYLYGRMRGGMAQFKGMQGAYIESGVLHIIEDNDLTYAYAVIEAGPIHIKRRKVG